MEGAGLPDAAMAAFRHHLERFLNGDTGTLGREQIEPASTLADIEYPGPTNLDRDLLARTVVVKLNVGLGTSMGLETAKSLIEVRPGTSFLDLIARQILALRQRTDSSIPLLLMNSFRTEKDTTEALAAYPGLAADGLPLGFLQHRVPKIHTEDRLPVAWAAEPELEWCPPGHGDI
ncbi:MAG: UTP--glucose-1-phosphate uridylyltransferase, partial [Candidatus Aminicenantes bacterium]